MKLKTQMEREATMVKVAYLGYDAGVDYVGDIADVKSLLGYINTHPDREIYSLKDFQNDF